VEVLVTMVSWLISNLQTAMLREDDPVSVFLVRLMAASALVWLTVHGTRGWMGR